MSKTKNKLPASEVIYGHEFKLVFTDSDADGEPWPTVYSERVFAETDGHDKIIRFNPAVPDDQLHATRIHEYVHATLHASGLSELLDEKLEEAIAVAIEHGFGPLIKFNRN